MCNWRQWTTNADEFAVFKLRKDCIIYYIVMMTNVFSSDGISCWNVFSFRSLYGSRLMNCQLTFCVRMNRRNGLNYQGLGGSSPSLLGLSLFLGGGSSRGFMMFSLPCFSLSSTGLLKF